MSENINYDYNNLTPFKWFIIENFPFMEDSIDGLTNYQLLVKLGNEINTNRDAINSIGENEEQVVNAFNSLNNYVNNYFDNLDVQDEINNKLDQMALDGTITNLIEGYMNPYLQQQTQQINALQASVNARVDTIQNELEALASGSPKGTYATVDALVAANPETGVYIVTENGHIYSWIHDGSSASDLGVYQANGVSEDDPVIQEIKEDISNIEDIVYDISESHNLIALNTPTSYPTNQYTLVENNDSISIIGQNSERTTVYIKVKEKYTFTPGTYYLCFSPGLVDTYEMYFTLWGTQIRATNVMEFTLAESRTIADNMILGSLLIPFTDVINWTGHVWLTKDAPEPYGPKGEIIKTPLDLVEKSEIPWLNKKPTILLLFDNSKYDAAATTIKQYGFRGTFNWGYTSAPLIPTSAQSIKQLIKDGNDIGLYGGLGDIPDTYTGSTSEEDWLEFMTAGVNELKKIGLYLPTLFGCPAHKGSNYIVSNAQKLGFKYVSCAFKLVNSDNYEDPSTVFYNVSQNAPDNIILRPISMAGKTYDYIKSLIDNAVTNKQTLPLFTHSISNDRPTLDVTPEIYNQLMTYIKSLSDTDQLEVLTAREYFQKYNVEEAIDRDHVRMINNVMDLRVQTND